MAQRCVSAWTLESIQYCTFALRQASIRRCDLIQPRFSEAVRSHWPSSRLDIRRSQTAGGVQTHHTFWSALKKRTAQWFGMPNSRAFANWSSNPKPHTKFIPVLQMPFDRERAKLLLKNLV